MVVLDRREENRKQYIFKDLWIGQCFLDKDGYVGIKSGDEEYLVQVLEGAGWDIACADPNEKVRLLR